MAKAPPKSPAPSRVRFIMVEAEMNDAGDLSQITQAIQNALRPAVGPVRIAGPASVRANGGAAALPPVHDAVLEPEEEAQEQEDVAEAEAPTRQGQQREKRKPPRIVTGIDWDSEVTFAAFVAEKNNPTSHLMRFLAVAAWFKQHRQTDAVTAGHAYTCYRHMKWPTPVMDWGQPFRDLKREQYVSNPSAGQYEINDLGLQHLDSPQRA